LTSVQPRIRLGRSFDQRSHTYLGYALRVRGNIGSEVREFLVGVGEGAPAKHQFQVGDTVSGEALPVADPRLETVGFYKVSDLKDTVREGYTEEDWVDDEGNFTPRSRRVKHRVQTAKTEHSNEGSIPSIEFLRSTTGYRCQIHQIPFLVPRRMGLKHRTE